MCVLAVGFRKRCRFRDARRTEVGSEGEGSGERGEREEGEVGREEEERVR